MKSLNKLMVGNAQVEEVEPLSVMNNMDKETLYKILSCTSESNFISLWSDYIGYDIPYLREEEVISALSQIIDESLGSQDLGRELGKLFCYNKRENWVNGYVWFNKTIFYTMNHLSYFLNVVLKDHTKKGKGVIFPCIHKKWEFELYEDYIEELECLLSKDEDSMVEYIGEVIGIYPEDLF